MSLSKIRKLSNQLSEQLQSQITLTSISDIIRELIQNSIDAKSTDIKLKVIYTGESINLECTDNGIGIDPDELEKLGRRHFTSKLPIGDDNSLNALKEVDTFGFRGESVNSMVGLTSSTTIISRTKEFNSAFSVIFTGSVRKGCANRSSLRIVDSGTSFLLVDLFGKIPVRKAQILKTKWEITASNIRNVVFESLLIHPDVKVNCIKVTQTGNIQDHKTFIKCGGHDKIVSLFREIYGKDTLKDYELINSKYKEYSINCILGTIPLQKKSHQYLFFNGRPLQNEDLLSKINEEYIKYDFGYSHLKNDVNDSPSKIYGKPFSTYPVFIIKIKSPIEALDLMQAPTKICHYSKHLKIIAPMIMKNIDLFLNNKVSKRSVVTKEQGSPIKKRKKQKEDAKDRIFLKSTSRVSGLVNKELEGKIGGNCKEDEHQRRLLNFDRFKQMRKHHHHHHNDECLNIIKQEDLEQVSPFFNNVFDFNLTGAVLKKCKIIGQVDNKFILIKFDNTLLILDQHACDERVNVENMYKEMIELKSANELDEEIEIEMEIEEIERLQLYAKALRRWGIKFIITDDNKSCITHLPVLIANRIKNDSILLRNGLRDYLDELGRKIKRSDYSSDEEDGNGNWTLDLNHMPEIYKEIIKSKACRSSIMFGDELSDNECKELIGRLSVCKDAFRCAHGRPSVAPLCSISLV